MLGMELEARRALAESLERLERAKKNEDYAARQFVRAVQQRQRAESECSRDVERHRGELADAEAA
jgi:hypothetical protein